MDKTYTLANRERLYLLKQVNIDIYKAERKPATLTRLTMLYNLKKKFTRKG